MPGEVLRGTPSSLQTGAPGYVTSTNTSLAMLSAFVSTRCTRAGSLHAVVRLMEAVIVAFLMQHCERGNNMLLIPLCLETSRV